MLVVRGYRATEEQEATGTHRPRNNHRRTRIRTLRKCTVLFEEKSMTNSFALLRRVVFGFSFAIVAIIVLFMSNDASTQTNSAEPRAVPARTIPVPNTVSPQMQTLIAGAPPANWNTAPTTVDEW